MNKGIANIEVIRNTLSNFTANQLSDGTGITLSTIKKLKSGERKIEKLNLADAIKLTDFGNKNTTAKIEIWK